jgi:hypothetical protein
LCPIERTILRPVTTTIASRARLAVGSFLSVLLTSCSAGSLPVPSHGERASEPAAVDAPAWGPLAVVDPSPPVALEAARAVGLNIDGTAVTVRDGDRVELGGGGSSTEESGVTGPDWVETVEWVARPGPSCPTDRRWRVSGVSTDR